MNFTDEELLQTQKLNPTDKKCKRKVETCLFFICLEFHSRKFFFLTAIVGEMSKSKALN